MEYVNLASGEAIPYKEFNEICVMMDEDQLKFSEFIKNYACKFGFPELANLIKSISENSYEEGHSAAY